MSEHEKLRHYDILAAKIAQFSSVGRVCFPKCHSDPIFSDSDIVKYDVSETQPSYNTMFEEGQCQLYEVKLMLAWTPSVRDIIIIPDKGLV